MSQIVTYDDMRNIIMREYEESNFDYSQLMLNDLLQGNFKGMYKNSYNAFTTYLMNKMNAYGASYYVDVKNLDKNYLYKHKISMKKRFINLYNSLHKK